MKKLIALSLSAALVLSMCVSISLAADVPAELNEFCTQQEWDVLKRTNQERLANGLTPYSIFPSLQKAADVREQELASQYSHTRPNGSAWHTALTEGGLAYNSAGENIAAGQTSARTAVQAWMDSDGHRKNILDASFTHMGTGYTDQSCTIITQTGTGHIRHGWVQLFLKDSCTITSISLSKDSATCTAGTSLDDLNLYIKATCSTHGACYLPVLSGMCTGFDPNADGTQAVTVSYAGHTQQLTVNSGSSVAPDLSSADSWAVDWINRADALSLLSQFNRSGFTENVTRLQFADLAVSLAQQLTGTEIIPAHGSTFTDTTDEVILKAKAAGIAGGYEVNGTYEFRPQNPITRQEICVMLAHVVDYVDSRNGTPAPIDRTETMTGSFPDTDQVAGWAVRQVALMTNNSVMSGRATDAGTMLTPLAHTTLQEAVTLTVKLHDLLK